MKKEILKVQCSCGQENHLVELEDGLRYDVDKHGNSELCNNQCFNCRASLGLEPEPVEEPVKEQVDEPVDDAVDDAVDEVVDEQVDETVDETADEAVDEMTDESAEETDGVDADDGLDSMNKLQLQERARKLEISVPFAATNKKIRKLIRAKLNGKKSE